MGLSPFPSARGLSLMMFESEYCCPSFRPPEGRDLCCFNHNSTVRVCFRPRVKIVDVSIRIRLFAFPLARRSRLMTLMSSVLVDQALCSCVGAVCVLCWAGWKRRGILLGVSIGDARQVMNLFSLKLVQSLFSAYPATLTFGIVFKKRISPFCKCANTQIL